MRDLLKYAAECMASLDRLGIRYAKDVRFTVKRTFREYRMPRRSSAAIHSAAYFCKSRIFSLSAAYHIQYFEKTP